MLKSIRLTIALIEDAPSETPRTSRISPTILPRESGGLACRGVPLTALCYAAARAGMHHTVPAPRQIIAFPARAVIICCTGRKDHDCALPMCNVSPYSLAKVDTRSRVALISVAER